MIVKIVKQKKIELNKNNIKLMLYIKYNMNKNINELFNDSTSDFFSANKVTISVEKRNGRKCITNVIGMADDLDLSKILSYLKKTYSCNGSIIKDATYGEVLSFTGDQKENIYNFFIDEEIYKKDDIIIKGI